MAQVLSPHCSATFSLPEPEAQPPTLAAIRAFRKLAGLWQLDMADQLPLLGPAAAGPLQEHGELRLLWLGDRFAAAS